MTTTRPQGGTRSPRARLSDRDEYPALGVAVKTATRSGIVMGPPPRVQLRVRTAGARVASPLVPVLETVTLPTPVVPPRTHVAPPAPVPEPVEVPAILPEPVAPEPLVVVVPEPLPVVVDAAALTVVEEAPEDAPVVESLVDAPLLARLPDVHPARRLARVAESALASPESRRAAVEVTRRTIMANRRRQVMLAAAVIFVIAGLVVGTWRFSARADAAARPDWNQIATTAAPATVRTSASAVPSDSRPSTVASTTDPSTAPTTAAVPANLPAALAKNPVLAKQITGACDRLGKPVSKDEAAASFTEYAACMDKVWAPLVGTGFKSLVLKTFETSVTSGCGAFSSSTTTAAYCPKDGTLYVSSKAIELAMTDRYYAIELVTHEYIHHVQMLTGIFQATFQAGWEPVERSRRAELNAHCLSFALIARVAGFDPTAADLAGFRAGWDGPGTTTYGSTESLRSWGEKGLTATTVADCNTFVVAAAAVS